MAVEFQAEDFVRAGPGLEAPQQDRGQRIRSCVPGFELCAEGGAAGPGSGQRCRPPRPGTVRKTVIGSERISEHE